jgi:hypothetical protein
MGIRRRRRKLSTLMSRLDQRVKSVELRPISLLTEDQINNAVDSGDFLSPPESFVGPSAPNQFYKIEDAYIYPKSIGLPEDRVEIYLEADLGAAKGDILEISGIHGTQNHDIDVDGDSFVVKSLDTPPWDGRSLPNGQIKDDPTDDQRPNVSITNAYSITPETQAPQNWNTFYRLQTKRAVDSYHIVGTTVTLTMNSTHKFKEGDVVFVGIFAQDSRAFGADGLFEIDSVTSNTIVYTLEAGIDEPEDPIEVEPLSVYVFPVARKFSRVGSTWTNSTNNTVYYWDGLRWVTWTTESAVPDDDDPPKPPTNVQVEGVLNVINGNYSSATVTISWTAPTESVSGAPLDDLAQYRVRWKRSDVANYGPFNIVPGNSTSFTDDGAGYAWLAGQTYNFQVQAVDSGNNPSESATATYTMPAGATVPLNQLRPSDPTTQLHLGTVAVKWDGLMSNNAPAPANLSLLEFHRSIADNFTPSDSTLIGTAAAVANATMVFSGHTIGTTYYYRIRLRGITPGSFSLPSNAVSAQTSSLVDAQRIADVIREANITPGTIISGESIIGLTVTGDLVQGNVIRGNIIEANSITALQIDVGSITAASVESGFITTRQFSVNQAGQVTGYTGQGITLDRNTGFAAYNSFGTPTITISNNGSVQIGGYVQDEDLAGYATTGDLTGYATVSALGGKLNTDADIGAIINGAVNQTTINGGRITTGTIDAQLLVSDMVLSSLIKLQDPNANLGRIELRGSGSNRGIVAFKNSGGGADNATFRLYTATGEAYLKDTFVDGNFTIQSGGSMIVQGPVSGGTFTGGTFRTSAGLYGRVNITSSSTFGTTGALNFEQSSQSIRGLNGIGVSATLALGSFASGSATTNLVYVNRLDGKLQISSSASDARLKDQVEDLGLGLNFVKELRPVKFVWKQDHHNKQQWGFIAQEARPALEANGVSLDNNPVSDVDYSRMVDGDNGKEGSLTFKDSKLVPVLVQAIKDMSSQLEELKARIEYLEGRQE